MAQANLPISFWGDALLTVAFVLNRVPSKSVNSTPYELWTGRKPSLDFLRPWGSMAYVLDSSHKYGKLGPRGKKCIFIRYFDTSKGYIFVGEDLSGSVTEFEARDATFLENEFPSQSEVTNGNIEFFEANPPLDNELHPSIEEEGGIYSSPPPQRASSIVMDEPEPRRSRREPVPRRRFDIEGGTSSIFLAAQDGLVEPRTVKDALSGPNSEKWMSAMQKELDSMKKNQVWDLVDLPKGCKSVGNKWVLKIKRKADGSIDCYKARLVAKGFTQIEGVDYEETFLPIVRFASIRLILSLVSSLDLELY